MDGFRVGLLECVCFLNSYEDSYISFQLGAVLSAFLTLSHASTLDTPKKCLHRLFSFVSGCEHLTIKSTPQLAPVDSETLFSLHCSMQVIFRNLLHAGIMDIIGLGRLFLSQSWLHLHSCVWFPRVCWAVKVLSWLFSLRWEWRVFEDSPVLLVLASHFSLFILTLWH